MHVAHQTAHWQAEGPTFYGDHLLFERLYTPLPDEFDALAEKMVSLFDKDAVDAMTIMEKTVEVLKRFDAAPAVERALDMERALQVTLKSVRASLQKANVLSMGMDNFLQGLSDSHETAVYLLQQTLRHPAG